MLPMTGNGFPDGSSTEGYTGESGRKASVEKIIAAIDREREKLGASTRGDRNRSLDWNNPRDRRLVRQKFQENGDVDEALLPGFGPKGFGENARETCGDPHPFICDSCGNGVEIGNICGLSVCSRCGVS